MGQNTVLKISVTQEEKKNIYIYISVDAGLSSRASAIAPLPLGNVFDATISSESQCSQKFWPTSTYVFYSFYSINVHV